MAWLRTQTDLPICIGFGISSPEQVRELAPVADGLIVGSALVRRLAEAANLPRVEVVKEIGQFLGELAAGLREADFITDAQTGGWPGRKSRGSRQTS